ncbi:hypothetical protein [Shewanella algae]|uniref:hypothetical protein n=1 Tax=Shewanella algae TaxID=38313 RepID=UPI0034D7A718
MRYSIYINQARAMEWGLNLQQSTLFSYLHDLPTWGKCVIVNGEAYWWSGKDKIIVELPILTDKPDTIKRHMAALEKAGLIERIVHQNKAMVRITEKGKLWNKSEESGEKIPDQVGKNFPAKSGEISRPSREKFPAYKNTRDQNTKILKEKSKPKKSEFDFSSWPEKPSEQVLADWMKVRKEQRAPLTQTAITRMAGELQQAHAGGISVDDCIGLAAEKGWRGFKYQWAINALGDNRNFGSGSRGQGSDAIDWDDNSWADGLVIQFPASGGKP